MLNQNSARLVTVSRWSKIFVQVIIDHRPVFREFPFRHFNLSPCPPVPVDYFFDIISVYRIFVIDVFVKIRYGHFIQSDNLIFLDKLVLQILCQRKKFWTDLVGKNMSQPQFQVIIF
jgi:hypothetical protein